MAMAREQPTDGRHADQGRGLSSVYVLLTVVGGLGVLGKVALMHAVGPKARPAVLVILSLWVLSGLLWRRWLRWKQVIAPLVLLGLVLFPLVVFPHVEAMHAVGRGSDQPDCILVASRNLAGERWPYDAAQMWTHNPLSCGPGWVALQAPVVVTAGYPVTMVLLLCGGVLLVLVRCGWDGLASWLTLLALAPGAWIAAADGTDFFTFGVLFAGLYAVAVRTRAGSALLAVALGLVVQFRMVTSWLPALLHRRFGRATALWATAIAVLTEAVFLLINPGKFIHDGPLHLVHKVGGSLPALPPAILVGGFLLISLLITALLFFAARRAPSGPLALGYLVLLFALPAIANLVASFRHYGLHLSALGFWEGGNWIAGCLPLAALLLSNGSRLSEQEGKPTSSLSGSAKSKASFPQPV